MSLNVKLLSVVPSFLVTLPILVGGCGAGEEDDADCGARSDD